MPSLIVGTQIAGTSAGNGVAATTQVLGEELSNYFNSGLTALLVIICILSIWWTCLQVFDIAQTENDVRRGRSRRRLRKWVRTKGNRPYPGDLHIFLGERKKLCTTAGEPRMQGHQLDWRAKCKRIPGALATFLGGTIIFHIFSLACQKARTMSTNNTSIRNRIYDKKNNKYDTKELVLPLAEFNAWGRRA